ncbi:hypothetical protein [uncultured Neptuniibacter sp.]|uniref:hypothetical protein n=1 Tax=uncultured Neptuniibacter sp. TaxID=502143 RepID=UPI002610E79A|nr:hypothetical protein [uncultured Neptuniibacter sp.]
MNLKTLAAIALMALLSAPAAFAGQDSGAGNRLVFNLMGSDDMYLGMVPDIDGDNLEDEAFCFDVDLVNGKNRQVIGSATDCLSNVEGGGQGGLMLVGTTFFNLPQGTLVTRGLTSVQPVNQVTVTPDGHPITHITGASVDGNAVLSGTGVFAGQEGTVRLSGMVDLSAFTGEGTPIFFDCLFIVDLE